MSLDLEPRRIERRLRQREYARSGIAVALALAMLLGLGYAAVAVGQSIIPKRAPSVLDWEGNGAGSVVVVVEKGDTPPLIGYTLARQGVVASARAFVRAARLRDSESKKIEPGTYELHAHMSGDAALTLLLDRQSRLIDKVTLPEGLRVDETLRLLALKTDLPVSAYLTALRSPAALGLPAYARGRSEGFLFPATYQIDPGTSAAAVLKTLIKRFQLAAKRVAFDPQRSAYEIVVIGSLVEGEARRAQDFGKVARVVYNRLAAGMPLQFDSTVNYVLKAHKKSLTQAELDRDSPYNTRLHTGLPPGPIGSPGEAALRAANRPTAGTWLYFVTTDEKTGLTKFTASYREFLTFKRELEANRAKAAQAAKAGKPVKPALPTKKK